MSSKERSWKLSAARSDNRKGLYYILNNRSLVMVQEVSASEWIGRFTEEKAVFKEP